MRFPVPHPPPPIIPPAELVKSIGYEAPAKKNKSFDDNKSYHEPIKRRRLDERKNPTKSTNYRNEKRTNPKTESRSKEQTRKPRFHSNRNEDHHRPEKLVPSLMSIRSQPPIIDNSMLRTTDTSYKTTESNDIRNTQINSNIGQGDIPSVNDLYNKLLDTGFLINSKGSSTNTELRQPKSISLRHPKQLKVRQPAIVDTLYAGIQCSGCGLRFPKHETIKYSQHLDWHYRQNRRERNTSRRAQARYWFYSVADWLQFEEIENIDDREKNWFELQQDDGDNGILDEVIAQPIIIPSCVAGPNDQNKICDMCHDPFDLFFNEESEEWHLRDAVRIEENTFHPVCYEDYKLSLESNASILAKEENIDLFKMDEQIPALDDDDDDVIVLPSIEPSITEILDDSEFIEASSSKLNVSNESHGKPIIMNL